MENMKYITTEESANKAFDDIMTRSEVGYDLETSGLIPHLHTIGLIILDEYVINARTTTGWKTRLPLLLTNDEIVKIGANITFDLYFAYHHCGHHYARNVWCVQSSDQIVTGSIHMEYSLAAVNKRRTGRELDKTVTKSFIDYEGSEFDNEQIKYAYEDTVDLKIIKAQQEAEAIETGTMSVVKLRNRVIPIVASDVQGMGVGFHFGKWMMLYKEKKKEMDDIWSKYLFSKKAKINWGHPASVKKWLNEKYNLDLKDTQGETLSRLKRDTTNASLKRLLDKLIRYLYLKQKVGLYGANLAPFYNDETQTLHGNFSYIADTLRFKPKEPNLNQLPRDNAYRKCFVARKGRKFLCSDYVSSEMAIAATVTGETLWLDALKEGKDLHSMTTAMMFEQEWAKRTPDCDFKPSGRCECSYHSALRTKGKNANLGKNYNLQAKSFSIKYEYSYEEGEDIYRRHGEALPILNHGLKMKGAFAKNHLYIRSFGKISAYRKFSNKQAPWSVNNQGMNTPIQMTGALILWLAMVILHDKIIDGGYDARIVMPVHDELLVECLEEDVDVISPMVKESMEFAASYILGNYLLKAETPSVLDYYKK